MCPPISPGLAPPALLLLLYPKSCLTVAGCVVRAEWLLMPSQPGSRSNVSVLVFPCPCAAAATKQQQMNQTARAGEKRTWRIVESPKIYRSSANTINKPMEGKIRRPCPRNPNDQPESPIKFESS